MFHQVRQMSSEDFHLDRVAIRMVKEPPLLSEFPINSPEAAIRIMTERFLPL